MKKKESISRILVLVVVFALAAAPQVTLLRQVNAQDPNGISMPTLQLRDLGIDNEVRQISSLGGAQARFFKRGFELKQKSIISPRDASDFKTDGDKRKADLLTIRSQLESLISKLKQGNHWNEAFDAQVLASLKNAGVRSLVTQAGGARKLFQSALDEVNIPRQEIDDEVLQVNSKQAGALRSRNDRIFAAHARPPVIMKVGCNLLAGLFVTASLAQGATASAIACDLAELYNKRGCSPKISCN